MAVRKRQRSAEPDEPAAAEPPGQEAARTIISAELVWHGRSIAISYEPDYLDSAGRGLRFSISHLEVQVTVPDGAPLPITETGYRSYFVSPGVVEEAGGPAGFVEARLREGAKAPAWRRIDARWRQLDLFA